MRSVIDFHTHILPSVDDGSSSVEESLSLLRKEAEQGVRHVVATPHFYANHQSPGTFLIQRKEAETRLREAVEGKNLPGITVGTEVHFFEGMSDCEFLPEMAIGDTGCVLVEMPMKQWSDRNLHELEGIFQKRGLTPIIAHVDRYMSPLHTHRIPERLARLPVLIQANASFFTGRFTKRMALRMLAAGQIHLLGTDCHNLDTRAPNMKEALQVIGQTLGSEAIARINSLEDELLPIR